MISLLGKTEDELIQFALDAGEAAFRGKQLYRSIHARRVLDLSLMTDLSKGLRETLGAMARVTETEIAGVFHSSDGTRRYLLRRCCLWTRGRSTTPSALITC